MYLVDLDLPVGKRYYFFCVDLIGTGTYPRAPGRILIQASSLPGCSTMTAVRPHGGGGKLIENSYMYM